MSFSKCIPLQGAMSFFSLTALIAVFSCSSAFAEIAALSGPIKCKPDSVAYGGSSFLLRGAAATGSGDEVTPTSYSDAASAEARKKAEEHALEICEANVFAERTRQGLANPFLNHPGCSNADCKEGDCEETFKQLRPFYNGDYREKITSCDERAIYDPQLNRTAYAYTCHAACEIVADKKVKYACTKCGSGKCAHVNIEGLEAFLTMPSL